MSMVERVATSLRDAMPGLVNPEAWPWETLARAAIAAMREPTDGMRNVNTLLDIGERGGPITKEDAADVWSDMIDAALAEG